MECLRSRLSSFKQVPLGPRTNGTFCVVNEPRRRAHSPQNFRPLGGGGGGGGEGSKRSGIEKWVEPVPSWSGCQGLRMVAHTYYLCIALCAHKFRPHVTPKAGKQGARLATAARQQGLALFTCTCESHSWGWSGWHLFFLVVSVLAHITCDSHSFSSL
jgi:hypothetical protein